MKTSPSIFAAFCKSEGLPEPVAEFRFHPVRRWRFDYAWPGEMVALEVEGGVFTRGRHTQPTGFIKDIEKYNAATCGGWRVLRCLPRDLCSAKTANMLWEVIEG